ncbi:MAG: DUF58 domain-containing protein, partial [Stellaceae bacterium]
PEMFIAAIPAFVALLSAARPVDPATVDIAVEPSATQVIEGDRLWVTVTLRSRRPVPTLELLLPLPPSVMSESGETWLVTRLVPTQPSTHRFALRAIVRDRARLGPIHLRTTDSSGLFVAETTIGGVELSIYPRMSRLRSLPRPNRTRTALGNYISPTLGEGLEPGEIRPFAPGDQVRQINWPVSLRLGQLHVTRFHQERNADVVLLLDTLASAGAPPYSTMDASVRAATALAGAYLMRKDRVGLVEYGGYLRWTKPASGRRHLSGLIEAVLPAEVVFTYVAKDLATVPATALPARSLIIAISPLIDERFGRAMLDLVGRGHDLLLLAVSPIAATRRALAPSQRNDLACRLWALEWHDQVGAWRGRGIPVVEWNPDTPLEEALAALPPSRRGRR